MQSLRHCSKPRDFVVSSIPDGGLLGVGSGQPIFAGFPTPMRIETVHEQFPGFSVLQEARRGLLARSLGSPDVVVPFGSGGRLRFRSLRLRLRECCDCRRVGLGGVDRQHSFRPTVVVGRAQYSRRGVTRYPSFGPLLLVRRIGSGLGHPCWRLVVSGRWSQWEICLSIILQQLRTIRLGLRNFQCLLARLSVWVFADNPSFLAYVPKQGGTHSCLLKVEAQLLLRWVENQSILLFPQFVVGTHNVVAFSLSRPNKVFGSKWTLAAQVVDQLVHRWPVNSDLFATALHHQMPVYFALMVGPASSGTDALLQCWSHLQVYTFPPFRLVRQVFNEFWELTNCEVTLVAPWWPQQEYFSDLQRLARFPPVALPLCSNLLRRPHFVVTISIHVCCIYTGGNCGAFCAGVGYVQCCGSSVGRLSSVFRAASLSTMLVGMSALMSFEGSWCPLCDVDLGFSFVFADVTRIFRLALRLGIYILFLCICGFLCSNL